MDVPVAFKVLPEYLLEDIVDYFFFVVQSVFIVPTYKFPP
jgi:hypothetical protein